MGNPIASALLVRVFAGALFLFVLSPLALAQVDTGVLVRADGKATVTATYRSYNRVTKVSAYDVTANVSATLTGPVYVVLEGLTGAGVTAANAAGTTTPGGLPYYQLSAGNVAAGAALTASVLLNNPSNVRVSFTPVVYANPTLATVPNVVGQTEASATATLQGAGLTATTSHAHHATVPVGRVISQQPAAGAQVAAGSAVAIVISDGPTLVAVPDVVSQTEASATAALQSAGLTATTSHANHATVVAGRVISQQPAAGAQVAAGSAVGIVISDGPVGGPLSILITSPSTLLTVGSTPIEVQGTVDNVSGPLTLTVNGAPVDVGAGGAFSASVALQEGHNAIVARAVTAAAEAAATISVSLDLTPPYITIESPADGSVVTTKFIAVTGLINDIVRGTVSDGQANVTVNGTAAAVANRTYLAENVELVEGLNTLTIRGADQVGNTNTVTTSVTYKVPAAKHIELVSGQSQRARIRATLAQSLQVKLFDELGDPVVDKAVVFRVTEGDGEVGFGSSSQGQAVLIKTDTNGVASTTMLLGSRAGNGNNRVTAKSVGFEGQVEFYASADPNPADKVSVHSGNTQRGGLNQPLPLPFVVNVTDDGSNVIAGAQVEFQVTTGGGKFQNGSPTYLATTDSDGRANATLTLGDEAGLDVHRVTATLAGSQLYAGFTASALVSGDPGQTSISGVVLDNQDQPLPNVTVRVDGTTREAKTNPQGQFKVTEVPVGPVHLIVDGATTTAPGEWPTLPYNIVTVAGADNPLAAPIYMVKLDTENAVWVGKEDKVITHPDMPGFALTVLKNSVTFPNGAREGYVSVTAVNASKIPMAPPNGMQPQLIVTIQPVGARFDPPAPLQMPNVDGHAPGAQVEMYSFDHDLEEFVAIGLGRVSLDGTVIASSPGVGVVKAGWHCGSQPTGGGCASGCGPCENCDANCNCQAKPGLDDASCCAAVLGGDRGAVACCRGNPIVCLDLPQLNNTSNPSVNALNVQCARVHEQTHIDTGVSCTPSQCKEPGTVPANQQNQSECSSYTAQINCMDAGMTTACPATNGPGGCSYGFGLAFPDECSCKQSVIVQINEYAKEANSNYGCGFFTLPACHFNGTCP